MSLNLESLLMPCLKLAKAAGQLILDIYKQPKTVKIRVKTDKSPVTQADVKAHYFIVAGLKKLTPDIPIISEEAVAIPFSERKTWTHYWLVDPLDGTKEFIHRTDEFTVNIAFIENGQAKMGIIYAPCYDVFYYAVTSLGAFKQINQSLPQEIHTRRVPAKETVVTLSRRHSVEKAEKLLQFIPHYKKIVKGSSLKSCVIAEGLADIYPSLGPTSEWDMGAAQCIVETAGGGMFDLELNPLRFNQKPSLINPPLIVVGDTEFNWRKILKTMRM